MKSSTISTRNCSVSSIENLADLNNKVDITANGPPSPLPKSPSNQKIKQSTTSKTSSTQNTSPIATPDDPSTSSPAPCASP